jgi:hypothetical protein
MIKKEREGDKMVYYAVSKNDRNIYPVVCESFMSAKKMFREIYDVDRKEGEEYIIFTFDDLLKLIFTKEVFETSALRFESIRRSEHFNEYKDQLLKEEINVYNTKHNVYENITVKMFMDVENKVPYLVNLRENTRYETYIPLVNMGDI